MTITKRNFLPIFSLLLVFVFVNNSSNFKLIALSMSGLLAGFSVLAVSLAFISIASKRRLEKDIFKLLTYFLVFSVATAFLSFNGPSPLLGLQRAFQLLSIWGVIYIFYIWGSVGNISVVFSSSYIFLIALITLYFFISLFIGAQSSFSGFLVNSNSFGMWITIVALMIAGVGKKYKFLLTFVIAAIYLVYISSSRTSLIALIVGLLILYMPGSLIYSKFFKNILMLFLFVFSFSAIYLTVYFDLSVYNEFVREASGKNLQSGRNFIWPIVLQAISNKPLLGWGSGSNLSDIFYFTFSVHNSFLQTIMQVGFFGFSLFLIILIKVYNLIYKVLNVRYLKLALSTFVALILMQSFEVTIFQNNLALSYPVWAIIGLVLGNNRLQKGLINE